MKKYCVMYQWSMFLLLIIALNLSACRTKSIFNERSKYTSKEMTETTELRSREQLAMEFTVAKDSSSENYQVRIFPVDSFQYSAAEGYRGKASQVIIAGLSERARNQVYGLIKREANRGSKDSFHVSQTDRADYSRAIKSEWPPPRILTAVIWMILGLLIGVFIYFRFLKYRGL